MAIKDTDRKARANYKKKVVTVRVELYGTDEDIREHIEQIKESGASVQGYIKDLIRADLQGREASQKEKLRELLERVNAGMDPAEVFKTEK